MATGGEGGELASELLVLSTKLAVAVIATLCLDDPMLLRLYLMSDLPKSKCAAIIFACGLL